MVENDPIKITQDTYNKTAHLFHELHSDVQSVRNLIDIFIENIKGNKILDIGCASGRDSRFFSEKGYDVIGIDMSKELLSIAKEFAPKAKFIHMDMRHPEFEPGSFDGIWCQASFLHIPKKEAKKTLSEFYKILMKNGLIYIGIKEGTGERFVENKKEHKGLKKYISYYSVKETKDLLEAHSFHIIDIFTEQKKDLWINAFARKQ
ncbi:MAG: methyltransferase domain-containing protein [Nanoarchaeota archaeon]|nr:methyltransferase domain-containing protein [Nanoarchaeota archaeon]